VAILMRPADRASRELIAAIPQPFECGRYGQEMFRK
jgi:hypothetical protein